jgi:hypothetical protein
MIDGSALFGGDDRMDGRNMSSAEDRRVVCHRAHAGRPRQGLKTGTVEIRFATEPFPAGHRYHRLEARMIGESDNVATVRPVHFEMARRGGRGTAVADIGAEDAKL